MSDGLTDKRGQDERHAYVVRFGRGEGNEHTHWHWGVTQDELRDELIELIEDGALVNGIAVYRITREARVRFSVTVVRKVEGFQFDG